MNILCKTSIILMGCETMTVKLEQYRIFKAIADTGNISRTAKQLYLSQSAVSQSLQQIESALGVRLFSRTARGGHGPAGGGAGCRSRHMLGYGAIGNTMGSVRKEIAKKSKKCLTFGWLFDRIAEPLETGRQTTKDFERN